MCPAGHGDPRASVQPDGHGVATIADQDMPEGEAIAHELRQLRLTMQKLDNTITTFCDQMQAERHKLFYSVKEVAELVGRSPYTIRRWVREGTIEGVHPDGTNSSAIVIPRQQVEMLLANRGA